MEEQGAAEELKKMTDSQKAALVSLLDRVMLIGLTVAFIGFVFFVICVFAGVAHIIIILPMLTGIIIELGAITISAWLNR